MEFLKSGHDPAVLNFDAHLMLNIVKLAMTASLFGLAAVFLKLPYGWISVRWYVDWTKLSRPLRRNSPGADSSSVWGHFLLFEQGLLYAQTYSDEPIPLETTLDDVDASLLVSPVIPAHRNDLKIHSRFSPNQAKGSFARTHALQDSPSFLDADDGHDPTAVGFIILTLLVFVGLCCFLHQRC
ncbi:hypothetical protein MHU86_8672 [Fragilaria crotonensis]|nr:hypothetical protein MHU86_8672 [Fragilaria crotonensis]